MLLVTHQSLEDEYLPVPGACVAGLSVAVSAAPSFLAPNPAKRDGVVGAVGAAAGAEAAEVLVAVGASGFFPKRFAPPNSDPAAGAGVVEDAVELVFSAGFPKRFGVADVAV